MKIILYLLITIISCSPKNTQQSIDPLNYQWENIINTSEGTSVSIYMWGGSDKINRTIDNIITPRLKELNNIKLTRVPISDIKDIINKLIVEIRAGKKTGSVDILWINGENFKLAKESHSLWGAFAKNLPNLPLVKDSTLNTDFGTSIDYYEVPWGEAQFNFIYKDNTSPPFSNAQSLLQYAKNNPERFTYPSIPDFTGSAFIRNIALDILGYENILVMSDEEFEKSLGVVWEFFRELNPYLWKRGATYPESAGKLDLLFQNNIVDIMMTYTINLVSQKIITQEYPSTSKSFLLDKGTLFNNHYLSIAHNAPNKAGALYVINYLISEEIQSLKSDPTLWGDFSVLDLSKISIETSNKIESFFNDSGQIPIKELVQKRIPELSPEKLTILEQSWLKNIAQGEN